MNPYFIQFIGFLGLLGIVISFQKDKRSFTLIAQLFATLFFTLHFSLLHAWSGAAMNAVAALRAYMFNLRDSKTYLDHRSVMYGFILLFLDRRLDRLETPYRRTSCRLHDHRVFCIVEPEDKKYPSRSHSKVLHNILQK
ncbi:MAG: YgjV family protein [Bacteroidales bacterium]|nr:YgjV family protein [Bacteroidales bacterium]